MRGRLAIPILGWRSDDLVAYCGHAVRGESPKLIFPKDFDPTCHLFGTEQAGEGEIRLMRDPLELMLASQNGADGGIGFLTESTSPTQLQMLAAMMEEKGVDTLEIA